MLLAIVLPLLILAVGGVVAVKGHRHNRRLTLGLAIILAVLALAVVLIRNPALVR